MFLLQVVDPNFLTNIITESHEAEKRKNTLKTLLDSINDSIDCVMEAAADQVE